MPTDPPSPISETDERGVGALLDHAEMLCEAVDRDRREPDKTVLHAYSLRADLRRVRDRVERYEAERRKLRVALRAAKSAVLCREPMSEELEHVIDAALSGGSDA